MNTHPDFEELLRLLEENHVDYMIVGTTLIQWIFAQPLAGSARTRELLPLRLEGTRPRFRKTFRVCRVASQAVQKKGWC